MHAPWFIFINLYIAMVRVFFFNMFLIYSFTSNSNPQKFVEYFKCYLIEFMYYTCQHLNVYFICVIAYLTI